MKQIVFGLFLLALVAPAFANDEGGDIAYIPDYQELVREGYGPRHEHARQAQQEQAPKPTQAFYGKGFTIYYGYTAVKAHGWNPASQYAFGYPLEFFRQMMPISGANVNLNNYAVALGNTSSLYGPGDFVAEAKREREQATTRVQSAANPANGTENLPAIGEKTGR